MKEIIITKKRDRDFYLFGILVANTIKDSNLSYSQNDLIEVFEQFRVLRNSRKNDKDYLIMTTLELLEKVLSNKKVGKSRRKKVI